MLQFGTNGSAISAMLFSIIFPTRKSCGLRMQ